MNTALMHTNEKATILVVAALAQELAPLRKRNLRGVASLVVGVGRKNAERRLRDWFTTHQADAVICLGFAGALSSSLEVADLVVDQTAWQAKHWFGQLSSTAIHFGKIITIDEIIGARGKRELAEQLEAQEIACVEMESAAVAQVCREHAVPCLLVRAISDLFDEDFPIDFNRCRDERGDMSRSKVMKAVLRRPQSIKPLVELGRRAALCAERLAAFVEQVLPTIDKQLIEGRKT
jgi:adenosylhomocysteine nucleosidase